MELNREVVYLLRYPSLRLFLSISRPLPWIRIPFGVGSSGNPKELVLDLGFLQGIHQNFFIEFLILFTAESLFFL